MPASVPDCPQCGSSHTVKLQLASAANAASDSFRCDACGRRWTAPKGLDGRALKSGDHACSIYSSRDELTPVVADFIAAGLRLGERCWYVSSGAEDDDVLSALNERGVDVARESKRGAFSLIPSSEAYPVQNTFEPEASMRVFNDAIEQALRDGFTGFRAAAEMSWALGPGGPSEELIVYEALLKSLFASARATGLCLYPRSTPERVMNGVLATHPLAATRGPMEPNPFYDARVRSLADVGRR